MKILNSDTAMLLAAISPSFSKGSAHDLTLVLNVRCPLVVCFPTYPCAHPLRVKV